MADEALKPLNDAVAARMAGRQPIAAQLAFAAKERWPLGYDLSTWNTFGGSQNKAVYAAIAFGDWPFLAALARHWRAEGLFGTEAGCDNRYYSSGVAQAMLLARRELLRVGSGQPPQALQWAEDIRLAVRAHLAFLALAAIPVTRVRDELVTGAGVVTGVRPGQKRGTPLGLAVAPAGNRFHPGRGGRVLTSDDAGSELLAAALNRREEYGLTLLEAATLSSVVHATGGGPAPAAAMERNAAREVSSWLYGTLAGWRWSLIRTDQGAERVFWAGSGATSGNRGPNPNKPCRSVGQVTPDRVYRGLQPSARGAKGWGAGYEVKLLVDSVYIARCAGGEAELQRLGGEVLWTISIDGPEVRFS